MHDTQWLRVLLSMHCVRPQKVRASPPSHSQHGYVNAWLYEVHTMVVAALNVWFHMGGAEAELASAGGKPTQRVSFTSVMLGRSGGSSHLGAGV
jgi:hypothetical protein